MICLINKNSRSCFEFFNLKLHQCVLLLQWSRSFCKVITAFNELVFPVYDALLSFDPLIFLFSSGYISITWLVSFKFIARNGHQLKISHGTFWFLHCSWTTTTSWPLVARGRTQNETTVNGTILQNSFHSAVQCEFILLKIFYSERISYRNFSKKKPALPNHSG